MLPEKIILTNTSTGTNHNNADSAAKKKVPDLFIYLQDQLISVVRQTLNHCELITHVQANQKIIFITQPLNIAGFKKIVDFLNGGQLQICTIKELAACLNIFDYLRGKIYIQEIERRIEQDIQSYDIFCLLELAYNYGMQKVFDLCLRYLEFDQFQQIKYNKFDFLECDFKLFQIVLRHHHILKMKGQIEGLETADVEEVIRTFCHRKQFDDTTLKRLLQKYVENLQKFEKVKTSLRLDKLAHKNILQSANIDTDFYDNEGLDEIKGIVQNSLKKSGIRKRKYSIEIKQKLQQMKINGDYPNQMANAQSIFQDSNEMGHDVFSIKVKSAGKKYEVPEIDNLNDPEIELHKCQQMKPSQAQPELVVSKISGLLNQYEEALNQHDQKYKSIRRNTRSMLFHNIGNHNDILSKAKLLNSINLKNQNQNQNQLFTIYQPNSR